MPRLNWNTPGQRFYETGVDRGVLYVDPNYGVAWNGLVSVTEDPNGGEARPFYVDGYKYLNLASAEEFAATLSAFQAPAEFGVCDGKVQIHNGLIATNQIRKSFNMSYRTALGNDTRGRGYGYKIHLVYNALAAPSSMTHATMGENTEATLFEWSITTKPPRINGYRPTSHFIVDSTNTTPAKLTQLEDILYGTPVAQPRIPTVEDLLALFAGA